MALMNPWQNSKKRTRVFLFRIILRQKFRIRNVPVNADPIFQFFFDPDIVTDSGGTGTRNQPKNGSECKFIKAFLNFCAKFYSYLMIFQSFYSTLKEHSIWKSLQIWQNFGKNEEKHCSTCLQPIYPWYCKYPKPGFRVICSATNCKWWYPYYSVVALAHHYYVSKM